MRKANLLLISVIILISCGPAIKSTKPYSAEVKLTVPFEPNIGASCVASSFAMVMRYWGRNVTVHDVVEVVGLPPFNKDPEFPKLARWMRKHHGLKLKWVPYSKIDHIKLYVREGYPVVVLQRYKLNNSMGHNRVVIGYSDKKACFIVNDSSPLGPAHEIPYDVFVRLWRGMKGLDGRPLPERNDAYLVTPSGKK